MQCPRQNCTHMGKTECHMTKQTAMPPSQSAVQSVAGSQRLWPEQTAVPRYILLSKLPKSLPFAATQLLTAAIQCNATSSREQSRTPGCLLPALALLPPTDSAGLLLPLWLPSAYCKSLNCPSSYGSQNTKVCCSAGWLLISQPANAATIVVAAGSG